MMAWMQKGECVHAGCSNRNAAAQKRSSAAAMCAARVPHHFERVIQQEVQQMILSHHCRLCIEPLDEETVLALSAGGQRLQRRRGGGGHRGESGKGGGGEETGWEAQCDQMNEMKLLRLRSACVQCCLMQRMAQWSSVRTDGVTAGRGSQRRGRPWSSRLSRSGADQPVSQMARRAGSRLEPTNTRRHESGAEGSAMETAAAAETRAATRRLPVALAALSCISRLPLRKQNQL